MDLRLPMAQIQRKIFWAPKNESPTTRVRIILPLPTYIHIWLLAWCLGPSRWLDVKNSHGVKTSDEAMTFHPQNDWKTLTRLTSTVRSVSRPSTMKSSYQQGDKKHDGSRKDDTRWDVTKQVSCTGTKPQNNVVGLRSTYESDGALWKHEQTKQMYPNVLTHTIKGITKLQSMNHEKERNKNGSWIKSFDCCSRRRSEFVKRRVRRAKEEQPEAVKVDGRSFFSRRGLTKEQIDRVFLSLKVTISEGWNLVKPISFETYRNDRALDQMLSCTVTLEGSFVAANDFASTWFVAQSWWDDRDDHSEILMVKRIV